MPEVQLRPVADEPDHARIIYIHKNRPGALRDLSNPLYEGQHNVEGQTSLSKGEVAYALVDASNIREEQLQALYEDLCNSKNCIKVRILY